MKDLVLKAPKGLGQWLSLYRLYRSAFPAAERKPFFYILKKHRQGAFHVWRMERRGEFVGLAITVLGEGLVLIDYLAVHPRHRGEGVGSAALAALDELYPTSGVFLEIESVWEDTPDLEQRKRRKAFYLRNGLTPMEVMICLFGVKMELLGIRCRLTYGQYYDFYMAHLGKWAAGHISQAAYPKL